MSILQLPGTILTVISLATFLAQAFAVIDAVSHRAEAYLAADKLTKPAWTIILGFAVVVHMLMWDPIGLLNIAGIIAALVYLLDVRPALRELTRR